MSAVARPRWRHGRRVNTLPSQPRRMPRASFSPASMHVDDPARDLVAVECDHPQGEVCRRVGQPALEVLVRVVEAAPVVLERLDVRVPHLLREVAGDGPELEALGQRDGSDVVERRPEHLEEPARGLEAGGAQECRVARLAVATPRAEDPGLLRDLGGGQLAHPLLVVAQERRADPAASPGRIDGAVQPILALAVGRVHPLAPGDGNRPALELGDRDVADRIEGIAGVAELRGEPIDGLPLGDAVGDRFGVQDANDVGQVRLAPVGAQPEVRCRAGSSPSPDSLQLARALGVALGRAERPQPERDEHDAHHEQRPDVADEGGQRDAVDEPGPHAVEGVRGRREPRDRPASSPGRTSIE